MMHKLFKNRYLKIILIFFLGSYLGCSRNSIRQDNNEINQFGSLIIHDTLNQKTNFDTDNCVAEAYFSPLYIGKQKDSIFLNYNPNEIVERNYNYDLYKEINPGYLSILVDTTREIDSINRSTFIPSVPSYNSTD